MLSTRCRQDVPKSSPKNPPILAKNPSASTIQNFSMTSTSGSVKINVCCDGNVLEYIGINKIYESQFQKLNTINSITL